MLKKLLLLPIAALLLSACDPVSPGASVPAAFNPAVPEEVIAMAAPFQNARTARLMPEDNCYWYLHAGPVETTLLPLRTRDGRPICVERTEEPEAAAS